jgi:NAD+ synthase
LNEEKQTISAALGVRVDFDAAREVQHRTEFLSYYLRKSSCRNFILGISGGVDSLAAGLLAQKAVSELRADGYDAKFIAVRLPYGVQADESDAQRSLAVIKPDRVVTIDIKPAADAMLDAVMVEGGDLVEPARKHFHLGNIKARQRMIAQYALAGATGGLVIGTDQAAEALMADLLPLSGLTKRRVRAIAEHMGAPSELVSKVPTADLETDAPLRPDEEVYGVTYEEIDKFLEGEAVADASRVRILRTYRASGHKRALPVTPID